jgi:hypothetical protein
VPRLVMRRPSPEVEGLGRASHTVPQVGRFAYHCPADRRVGVGSRLRVWRVRRKAEPRLLWDHGRLRRI